MTRTDYLAFAAAMRMTGPFPDASIQAKTQWRKDCYAIAGVLGAGSSAFDRALFLKNCGVDL